MGNCCRKSVSSTAVWADDDWETLGDDNHKMVLFDADAGEDHHGVVGVRRQGPAAAAGGGVGEGGEDKSVEEGAGGADVESRDARLVVRTDSGEADQFRRRRRLVCRRG
ncbi:unnamed protein product [Linum tenue]|uniref:Uncharacterized protein n=1 Tax=Linum tenue TaxID=586396 RepID=A0AAV0PDB4_9ROSI|nr:unnamed protein product [Linum tenue]